MGFRSCRSYITATVDGVSANVGGFGDQVNQPTNGPCPGDTGTAPTTLDDGSSCPSGLIVVPGNSTFGTKAFCVMKYDAKNDGSGHPQSVAAGTPWSTFPKPVPLPPANPPWTNPVMRSLVATSLPRASG